MMSIASYAQTTLEEYNYVTKGYQIQKESGLDMKKGYRLIELHQNSTIIKTKTDVRLLGSDKYANVKRAMSFRGLYRDGENAPCAIMIAYKRLDNGFVQYLCVPHKDSSDEIWQMFFKDISTYGQEGAQTLAWGLAKCAAYFAANN